MPDPPARVTSLWRHPVKSLAGAGVAEIDVDSRGVVGDREWAVRTSDNKIGSGKSTRRFAAVPGLLLLRGHAAGDEVTVTLPTGATYLTHDGAAARALSEFLGRPVSLARELARQNDVDHFDDGPVSLIGAASVAALAAEVGAEVDPRRFRANILLDGLPPFGEDTLVGHRIHVGQVLLEVIMVSTRCVMIDMETADLPAQPGNLRALGGLNDACLGVVARVVAPGRIRLGDALVVSSP